MEDNINVAESQLDLSALNQLEKLDSLIENQQQIIKQNQILIDYFVPTEKELKEQAKQEEIKQLEEQEKQKELEQQQKEQYEQYLEDVKGLYSQDLETISRQLTVLNENTTGSLDVQTTSSGLIYVLVLGLLLTFVSYYFYKLIRNWFI